MDVKLSAAIDTATGETVNADDAPKEPTWSYPFCMQEVILKRGSTKQDHFAHKFFAC